MNTTNRISAEVAAKSLVSFGRGSSATIMLLESRASNDFQCFEEL